jgi:hypothetical protein
MLNVFYKLIGFFAKVIASIVVLVIVIGSATNYLYNEENSNNGVSKTPNVKFANFKEFKNEQNKVISKKEQKVLQAKFQDEFLTKFALISKNISIYATETKQVVPDVEKLEEGLFMIISKFDYTNRSSYLTQLLKETNKLVNYSEVVAIDKTKTTIKWVEFLDWFTADFEYQLKNNIIKKEYITIEVTQFEKIVISGIGLLLLMLSIIMLLVIRPAPKKHHHIKKETTCKAKAKEETPTDVKTQTKVDTTEETAKTKVEEDKTKAKVETKSTDKETTTKVDTTKENTKTKVEEDKTKAKVNTPTEVKTQTKINTTKETAKVETKTTAKVATPKTPVQPNTKK